MHIALDCRHIKWDRPCKFHKEYGAHCEGCPHYSRIDFKILIIKLEAVGDVLRTTCILHGLKEKYKDSHITWVTGIAAFPLFQNNNLVDIVLDCSAESLLRMQSEVYDLVFNPDASPNSAILATLAKGKVKRGFGYNEKGHVYPFDQEAQKWFEMGMFDDIKKANTETYQKIISDMLGAWSSTYDIIFNLDESERSLAEHFAEKHKVSEEDLVIGLNTGAGGRWQNKKWTRKGYLDLIRLIKKELKGCKILLYGGIEETERNRYLMKREDGLIDTGCHNTLREFGAMLNLCDILVTGDTMALHIAVALKKKVVALFGPTSQAEIELYSRGKKLFADMDCLCCYRPTCDIKPSCMDRITPEQVFVAIKEVI
jgi:heptosyltransferase-2